MIDNITIGWIYFKNKPYIRVVNIPVYENEMVTAEPTA